MAEAWENLRQLPPSRYGWYVAGMAGLGMALYLVLAEVNLGVLFLAALMVVFLYRHVRNRPYRVQELFVRRVSKIPEVRLIVFQDRQITVVVDRPVAQLYGRINDRLRACNRKLYAGQPLTVAILHDLPSDEVRRLQGGPGVHFVRAENAKQGGTSN